MTEMNDRLLDAAEAAVRLRGYHAVSFRELADDLGIKSASVHYYYRQKEDLGLALVARYQTRFFHRLDECAAGASNFDEALAAFIAVYREALVGSDRICLCGMLGAESSGLPPPVAASVAGFFKANIDWLDERMPEPWPSVTRRGRADAIVASLQGAMMLAASIKDHARFDAIADELQSRFGTL